MTANPQTAVTRIPLPSHSAEGVNNVTQASVS